MSWECLEKCLIKMLKNVDKQTEYIVFGYLRQIHEMLVSQQVNGFYWNTVPPLVNNTCLAYCYLLYKHKIEIPFEAMATVFLFKKKLWVENTSGLVRFIGDAISGKTRLILKPDTSDQFECILQPAIRSKGPRAYVVKTISSISKPEQIYATRFEQEEDAKGFRKWVETLNDDEHRMVWQNESRKSPN
eukprot:137290_1